MKVGVIGAGAMGSGIGQVAAQAGDEVLWYDAHSASLSKSKDTISASWQKLVEKGKFTEDQVSQFLSNVSWVADFDQLADCELIIEAIVEDFDAKSQLFKALEAIISPNCIIASNTSALSITALAASIQSSERVLGLHFFNPASIMKLVEIIPALQTNVRYTEQVTQIAQPWGKVPVLAKNTPGFIVNRVARCFYFIFHLSDQKRGFR